MKSAFTLSGVLVGLMLLVATGMAVSGCDGPSGSTETKPIQTDILKKLGQASQAQSNAARSEHAKDKAKKR
jgi:hypothetical protein